MQCSSTAIYISGLMISSSAQPMRFSLSSTTRSLKMNWIIYFQICYLKYGVPCAVLYMIIGDIPSPPMVWELVSRSGGATFQLSPISPDHLALPQTLWPGRTGSALAWLKMLINGEIKEEEPNFRPLLFQQLFYLIYTFYFKIRACSLYQFMHAEISCIFALKFESLFVKRILEEWV